MAHLSTSAATLRISSDILIPDEITSQLGCNPTTCQSKGEIIIGKDTGKKRVAKIGLWRLSSTDREPENLDSQVAEILNKLTNDIDIWIKLSTNHKIDLFCGLFMEIGNEGLSISAVTLKMLGERGIELGLDIYGPVEEEA